MFYSLPPTSSPVPLRSPSSRRRADGKARFIFLGEATVAALWAFLFFSDGLSAVGASMVFLSGGIAVLAWRAHRSFCQLPQILATDFLAAPSRMWWGRTSPRLLEATLAFERIDQVVVELEEEEFYLLSSVCVIALHSGEEVADFVEFSPN